MAPSPGPQTDTEETLTHLKRIVLQLKAAADCWCGRLLLALLLLLLLVRGIPLLLVCKRAHPALSQ